jgi:uncharacterized protein YaiL (DUF2058 family)
MPSTQDVQTVRDLETQDDYEEAREESVGYIFHGGLIKGRRTTSKNGNMLHFARCNKIDKLAVDRALEPELWCGIMEVVQAVRGRSHAETA